MAVSDLKYIFTSEKLFSLSDKEIMLKTETLIFFIYLGVKDIQVHDIMDPKIYQLRGQVKKQKQ